MSKYGGLCETCIKAETCVYQRDPNRPVLQCEEFDGYEPKTMKKPDTNPLRSNVDQVESSAQEKDSNMFVGLCSNCENRHTCVYPKPEGGVWHCEEYS